MSMLLANLLFIELLLLVGFYVIRLTVFVNVQEICCLYACSVCYSCLMFLSEMITPLVIPFHMALFVLNPVQWSL